jgi:hypothetical protein
MPVSNQDSAPNHFPDNAFLASATVIIKIMGSTGDARNP